MREGLASVLINNRDYAEFVGAAIESALAQTYADVEIVVVDDGSVDDSLEVIARFGDAITVVRHEESRGQPAAINSALAAARGEFLFLLDADDRFCATKVADVVAALRDHPSAGGCLHARDFIVDGAAAPGPALELDGLADLRSMFRRGRMPYISTTTSAMCFRRDALESLAPLPELESDNLGDHYFKWALLATTPVLFDRRRLALQRLHGRNRYTKDRDWRLNSYKQLVNAVWVHRRVPGGARFARRLAAEATAERLRHGAYRPDPAARAYAAEVGVAGVGAVVVQAAGILASRAARRLERRRSRTLTASPAAP